MQGMLASPATPAASLYPLAVMQKYSSAHTHQGVLVHYHSQLATHQTDKSKGAPQLRPTQVAVHRCLHVLLVFVHEVAPIALSTIAAV